MAVRTNPNLINELEHFGVIDAAKCYQCGNCSAVCKFSGGETVFPRKSMHYLQLGMEKPLRGSLNPWLCYYCGDCSDRCPRGAEPGESMMGMRRWLTAQYDFTGISKLLYRSWVAELVVLLGMALLSGIGFLCMGYLSGGGNLAVYDGPNAFLPLHQVHVFDWCMGLTLAFMLSINCVRMWSFTMRGANKPPAPFALYLRYLVLLPLHFITQKRLKDCGEDRRPWVAHLVLVSSYATIFVLIMFFLKDMWSGPQIDWRFHFFGYLASIGLLATTVLAMHGRIKKTKTYHRHSHESDWIFLILLFYVSLSGVVQHVLHRVGYPEAANIAFILHLMGVVPMLGSEVPFGKWSHMAYRPLAIYFARVQRAAQAIQDEKSAASGQAAESRQVA